MEDCLRQRTQLVSVQLEALKVSESLEDRLRQRTQLVAVQTEGREVREAPEDGLRQVAQFIEGQIDNRAGAMLLKTPILSACSCPLR